MNVYVVAKGVRDSGQWPVRVFTSLPDAKRFATQQWNVELHREDLTAWKATWNGRDEIWIHRVELWGKRP